VLLEKLCQYHGMDDIKILNYLVEHDRVECLIGIKTTKFYSFIPAVLKKLVCRRKEGLVFSKNNRRKEKIEE
jgi:hypothetical protein